MGPTQAPTTPRSRSKRSTPLGVYAWAAGGLALAASGVLAAAWVPDVLLTDGLLDKHLFAGGLCVVLLALQSAALHRMTKRARALEQLGDTLASSGQGERDPEALRITSSSDAVSTQWNRLLDELAEAQQAARDAKTVDQLTRSTRRGGDHEKVFDALPHGVVVIDADARVTAANGAASRVLMRSPDRLVGAPMDKVIADAPLRELIQDVLGQQSQRGGTIELQLNGEEDQQAIMRATVRPVGRGDQHHGAVVYFEDLTQQRTADQSRNLFVAQATHELRTPLTNIGLYLERAIDLDDDETADRAECLNVINQEVLRLGRVVEEVLSVSEIEAGSLKVRRDDVKVDELLRTLAQEYQPQARDKDIQLTFDLPPKLSVVQGDREKITVALHNLLGNALKYTPAGGNVQVQLLEADGELQVNVTDTGIGIKEDELAKVFEKFYRADDRRLQDIGGSGLGLALARDVIRLHGGDITVESELNQGSTFTLRLPIQTAVHQP